MTVNYTIKGYIRNGELHIDLPKDIVEAEVEMQVTVLDEPVNDDAPLTDEEIEGFLKSKPGKTGAEIAQSPEIGAWAHMGITDSVEWVNELKRKRRERHQW